MSDESANAGSAIANAANIGESSDASLPVRAMKWLVQFKIASRQRLQPVSFNEYLHRVDAFDARYRVDERFKLTVLSERPSSLLL